MSYDLLELFDQAIEKHKLRGIWRDGLFTNTDEERDEREAEKYNEAKENYLKMMRSPKSKSNLGYQQWAIQTALKIKPTKARHRSSLNKGRYSGRYGG